MEDKLFTLPAEPQHHTNEELYHRQMEMLKSFLEHGAISQEQYNKSAGDLTVKMGFAKASGKDN